MVVVYLDYRVSPGPFLRFSMRFEFLSKMSDHLVCETRDPSLTIFQEKQLEMRATMQGTLKAFIRGGAVYP